MMSMFEDKFHLSPEQSLFLAKKKWDENVYCGMKMENRAVTFPQTQTILNGVNVPNVQLDDIQAILNMRDAWKFLLSTINEEVTFEYWCKLNEYIARNEALEWGKLRTGSVGISGTDYESPIPTKEKTIEELENILFASNASATDKALEAFTWGARGQFFWDGNKRTARLMASGILLNAGIGVFNIRATDILEFNTRMLKFYDTGNADHVLPFLAEKCVVYEALDDAYCQKLLDESKNNLESREFTPFDDFVRELRGNAK